MNILTIDIEDWFHILDQEETSYSKWASYEVRIHNNVDRILEMLDSHYVKATFFCLGWIAEQYPEVIKKIHSSGHHIGSHSNLHVLANKVNYKEFSEDLKASINNIEDLIGVKVDTYRAPGFSINEDSGYVFELLYKNGIKTDSSFFCSTHTHGGVSKKIKPKPLLLNFKGSIIYEFPISSYNFVYRIPFTGGGYFRFIPYPFIQYFFKNSNYNVSYFHPRDFDSGQPVIKDFSFIRKFKSYYGLNSSFSKFKSLIKSFDFISLEDAMHVVNWNKTEKINLN